MAFELPPYNPRDSTGSGERVFKKLVEAHGMPVEPAVTTTMTMITQIDPNITDLQLGELWRVLHDKHLMPSIHIRHERKPTQ